MILIWCNGARWAETRETYFVRVANEAEADEVETLVRSSMAQGYRVVVFEEIGPIKADLVKTPEEFLLSVWAGHDPSCPSYSDSAQACACGRAAAMKWIEQRAAASAADTDRIALGDLEPGTIFERSDGSMAVKTKYSFDTEQMAVECVLLASNAEPFRGACVHLAKSTLVRRVDVHAGSKQGAEFNGLTVNDLTAKALDLFNATVPRKAAT